MRRLFTIAAVVAIVLAPVSAHAGGSDSPTPYTVDNSGITLPSSFRDNDHVNIRTIDGRTANIHAEGKCATRTDAECAGQRHEVAKLIGQKRIPWSVFGLESPCVSWVQVAGYNEHYGEGGQSPVGPGCSSPEPEPEPEPEPLPAPERDERQVFTECVEDGVAEYATERRWRGAYRGDDGEIYWGEWGAWEAVSTSTSEDEQCDPAPEPEPQPIPEPEPVPAPKPDPEPAPAPRPDPEPAPAPEPEPEPQPDPATQPALKSDPASPATEAGTRTAAASTASTAGATLPSTGAAAPLLLIAAGLPLIGTGVYFLRKRHDS